MPGSLMVYRITEENQKLLAAKFPDSFLQGQTYYGMFLVETKNPKIQLIMTPRSLQKNFEYTAREDDMSFSAVPRPLSAYLTLR